MSMYSSLEEPPISTLESWKHTHPCLVQMWQDLLVETRPTPAIQTANGNLPVGQGPPSGMEQPSATGSALSDWELGTALVQGGGDGLLLHGEDPFGFYLPPNVAWDAIYGFLGNSGNDGVSGPWPPLVESGHGNDAFVDTRGWMSFL